MMHIRAVHREMRIVHIFPACQSCAMTHGTDIQTRLRSAGLTQADLAAMLRVSPSTMHRQCIGAVPLSGYLLAFLAAWEMLTEDQRSELRVRLSEPA